MKIMVSTGFQGSSGEIQALIPQEQAHIKALMERGIVEALYIRDLRKLNYPKDGRGV
jgi:hypothetical protein